MPKRCIQNLYAETKTMIKLIHCISLRHIHNVSIELSKEEADVYQNLRQLVGYLYQIYLYRYYKLRTRQIDKERKKKRSKKKLAFCVFCSPSFSGHHSLVFIYSVVR
jgi:hypothetical protein